MPTQSTLVVWRSEFRKQWTFADLLNVRIPAGEYRYALLGPLYERSGKPDSAGMLRCRRFHVYEATILTAIGDDTSIQNIGDSY